MRKIITMSVILVMVLMGFVALANPIASTDEVGEITIEKWADPICRYGKYFPGNDQVPLGEDVYWDLTIHIENNLGYDIEDAVVKDRLGAELEVVDFDIPAVGEIDEKYIHPADSSWYFYVKGGSDKVFLVWENIDIPDGETATLTIVISTDINPAGKQEYTSIGDYYLNSGATLKWLDPDVEQHSLTSNKIMITVVGEEED